MKPIPTLTLPEREYASADCRRIVAESSSMAEVASKLERRFPDHIIHGDQDGVGVYERLNSFDAASGRLGKIGECRFYTRAKTS